MGLRKMVAVALALACGLLVITPLQAAAATTSTVTGTTVVAGSPAKVALAAGPTCQQAPASTTNGKATVSVKNDQNGDFLGKIEVSTMIKLPKGVYDVRIADLTVDEAGNIIGCSQTPVKVFRSWSSYCYTWVWYSTPLGVGEHVVQVVVEKHDELSSGWVSKPFKAVVG